MDGKAIFLNYWAYPISSPTYNITYLPRGSKNMTSDSVSIAKTINISINKYISDNAIKSASKVIEYLTSRDIQKKYADQISVISAMNDLYHEEDEICQLLDCSLIHVMQGKGNVVLGDYYRNPDSVKIKKYFYDYLFNNESMSTVVKRIGDLTKVYTISIKPTIEDGYVGFFVFIYLMFLTLLMIFSLVFLFMENFNPFFQFLSQDLWIINILGNIFTMGSGFIKYGVVNNWKCYINSVFLSLGFTISYSPILYTLILYFPNDNKVSRWAYKHKQLFFIILISIDIFIFIFSATQPFEIVKNIDEMGHIYNTCGNKKLRNLIYLLMMGYKFLIIIVIAFLIFIDWNLEEIHYDLKFIISGI